MPQTLSDFLKAQGGKFEQDGLTYAVVTPEDKAGLEATYADFATRHLVVPMTAYPPEGKINRFVASWETGLGIMKVTAKVKIGDKEFDKCIGFAGLTWMDDKRTKVEYNRVLRCWAKGKGYGTRIVKCLCDITFAHLGFDTIYGENLSYNTAAQRSAEKVGMKPAGFSFLGDTIHGGGNYKDTICTVYRLTRQEYEESSTEMQHSSARSIQDARDEAFDILQKLSVTPTGELREQLHTGINAMQRIFLLQALSSRKKVPEDTKPLDEETAYQRISSLIPRQRV
jgi:RimJ/RimL family protein N-acetyltransferase